jgi:hypothetical protein
LKTKTNQNEDKVGENKRTKNEKVWRTKIRNSLLFSAEYATEKPELNVLVISQFSKKMNFFAFLFLSSTFLLLAFCDDVFEGGSLAVPTRKFINDSNS